MNDPEYQQTREYADDWNGPVPLSVGCLLSILAIVVPFAVALVYHALVAK